MLNYRQRLAQEAAALGAVRILFVDHHQPYGPEPFTQAHFFNGEGREVAMYNDFGPELSALQTFSPPRVWGVERLNDRFTTIRHAPVAPKQRSASEILIPRDYETAEDDRLGNMDFIEDQKHDLWDVRHLVWALRHVVL